MLWEPPVWRDEFEGEVQSMVDEVTFELDCDEWRECGQDG